MRLATPRIASRATPTYSGSAGDVELDTRFAHRCRHRPLLPYFELGQRVRFVAVDVEDLRQAGDLEDPQDAQIVADQSQVAIPLAGALQAADQHPEPGAVQVLARR